MTGKTKRTVESAPVLRGAGLAEAWPAVEGAMIRSESSCVGCEKGGLSRQQSSVKFSEASKISQKML